MADTIFSPIRKMLRDRMNDITDDVATGTARDFAQYRHLCGKIEGLAEAERIILDLEAQYERGEDADSD